MHTSPQIRICLNIIFIFLLLPVHALSRENHQTLDKARIESLFRQIVEAQAPWSKSDIIVANISSRPTKLTVKQGSLSYELFSPPNPTRLGRRSYSVGLLIDGQRAGKMTISGDVGLYGNVVCSRRHLKRNTILSPNDLVTVRRDISMLGPGFISNPDMATGQRLTTSLQSGKILYSHFVVLPPLVQRGDLVTILAKTENVQISAPGEIKNKGGKGEVVKVKNLMSRREIFARVVDSVTVAVDY